MQKGINGARSDDTKGLKGAILDMISSHDQHLHLKLARNSKEGRGFHHECTGALLCPAGLDWNQPESVKKIPLTSFRPRADICLRVKEKLASGEMMIPGDQWPVFLYVGSKYNPLDAWSGLLRSAILLSVCCTVTPEPSPKLTDGY